jgi:hypothetical protein
MGHLTFHVLLFAAISAVATAYNTWTVTHYYEDYTYTATTSTLAGGLLESISFQADYIEVTPTEPLQGTSTATITNTIGGYGALFTLYDVNINLSPNQLPLPPTPSAIPTGLTTNVDGYWEVNSTSVEFLEPVLFTPPASCQPGTDRSMYTTLTHSSYSFTSLVSLEYITSDIVSQVVAAATLTATTTSTEGASTITVIQYVVPSTMFPVPNTQPSYYSAMGIDPCVDPRVTQVSGTGTGATASTASSKNDGRRDVNYRQAYIPAVLAAGAVAGESGH